MSIVDRRGFIFSRSAEHPESVRIIASIATSKPVAVNPNNLTLSQRPRLAKNRHSDTTMATLASSKAELNYKVRQQQFPTTTQRSFFDLPDANTWRPALVQQSRTNGDFNRPLNQWRFQQPLGGQQFDQEDAFNMTKLLTTVSRIFGVNLAEEDPHLYANRDAISADRSSWVTLSYLSLSLFLLRQMDHLLKLQSEPLDPVLMQQRGRSFNNYQSNPWTNNSLNLLFIEPGVNTDVERVVNNEENVEQPNGYLWAAHNILKASKDSDRIDCLWSAYCFELDNRATLDGKRTLLLPHPITIGTNEFSKMKFDSSIYAGLAGKVARVNGIVLKMVTGWLSPPAAMIKLLRSSFNWDGINCNRLFPRY